MDGNPALKRFMKRAVYIGGLLAIALVFGLFFAFGGDNPVLTHVANVIDMILVAVTVLFLLGLMYGLYMMVTGQGLSRTKAPKKKVSSNQDELPELTELLDNLNG